MESERFDDLAKILARGASRRELVKAIAGAAGGGALVLLGAGRAGARNNRVTGVCHLTGDTAHPVEYIEIDAKSVPDHLAHGDQPSTSTTACGKQCVNCQSGAPANTVPACTNGACTYACAPSYADCNQSLSDGCEVSLATDTTNCGACGYACAAHAPANTTVAGCSSGSCQYACAAGFADCNGNSADGCETLLGTNANCAGCGDTCGRNASCVSGVCTCDAGYSDCDGDGNCECPTGIAILNASAACGPDDEGVVGCNLACNPGFFDTNGDIADANDQFNPNNNGCECDLTPESGKCFCNPANPTGVTCPADTICDNGCRCKALDDPTGQQCQPLVSTYRLR